MDEVRKLIQSETDKVRIVIQACKDAQIHDEIVSRDALGVDAVVIAQYGLLVLFPNPLFVYIPKLNGEEHMGRITRS